MKQMKQWIITGVIIAFAVWSAAPSLAQDRPNVVVIMVDDLGFSDIGCYGAEIETPNLDALATEGLRFSQFYNTAKCHSSRVSLLSGQLKTPSRDLNIRSIRSCARSVCPRYNSIGFDQS